MIFFQENLFTLYFFNFRGLACDFFKFNEFPSLRERQTPLSNNKSLKVTKNVIDFYFRMWNLIIRFPSEIKFLHIDPVFSN